jgi:hypothetical protein
VFWLLPAERPAVAVSVAPVSLPVRLHLRALPEHLLLFVDLNAGQLQMLHGPLGDLPPGLIWVRQDRGSDLIANTENWLRAWSLRTALLQMAGPPGRFDLHGRPLGPARKQVNGDQA